MKPSVINLLLLARLLTMGASDDGSEYPSSKAKQWPSEHRQHFVDIAHPYSTACNPVSSATIGIGSQM